MFIPHKCPRCDSHILTENTMYFDIYTCNNINCKYIIEISSYSVTEQFKVGDFFIFNSKYLTQDIGHCLMTPEWAKDTYDTVTLPFAVNNNININRLKSYILLM